MARSGLLRKITANLIQGVSQQAVQQRRETQCEAQFDCFNSPLTGCSARPGTDLLRLDEGVDLQGCFFFELNRGEENYLLAVKPDGSIKGYDLIDGLDCTITYASGTSTYLANAAPESGLRVQALEDYNMIVNKAKVPVLGTALSSTRDPEALIFVKAGGYSSDYNITATSGASSYTLLVRSAENNSTNDEARIQTNRIAQLIAAGLTGDVSDSFNAGPEVYSTTFPNDGSWLTERTGSSVRLWRDDGGDFTISTEAANSDQNLRAFKETARALSDLPRVAFPGFILKVRGAERTADDDYWVEFKGTGDSGYWEERVGPGLPYQLNSSFMPHALVSTGVKTFHLQKQTYGARIAGDDDTAKVPSFVGGNVTDLFYSNSRFAIMTDGGCVWSKTNFPFTFFVDTVQTRLVTAPVDIKQPASGTSRGPSFLERAVQIKEGLYLWSQRSQFRVTSNNEQFKADTVENHSDTNLEFSSSVNPLGIGASLYFSTESGPFATVRNLPFSQGRSEEPISVTSHVGRYIPSGLKGVTGSDTNNCLFWWTAGDSDKLYVYNYLLQAKEYVQSAWNTWRLPGGPILWAGIRRNTLSILQQRAEGVTILQCDLSPMPLDEETIGMDLKDRYKIRLDNRLKAADVTVGYSAGTGLSTITLPYVPIGADVKLVVRGGTNSSGDPLRGIVAHLTPIASGVYTTMGDYSELDFWVGQQITAERTESEFVERDAQGAPQAPRELDIQEFRVNYSDTAYTRLEVTVEDGSSRLQVYEGRKAGFGAGLTGIPQIKNGKLAITCNTRAEALKVRLVNDTPFPSYWQSAMWIYEVAPV